MGMTAGNLPIFLDYLRFFHFAVQIFKIRTTKRKKYTELRAIVCIIFNN